MHFRENMASVCRRLGRNAAQITLVGATKYATPAQIKEAVDAGLHHIGENRVQEAQQKFSVLHGLHVKVTKHMIGHLQTNKVKQAVELFDFIQSVDSIKLVKEIETQAEKLHKDVNILIEVNTSGEEQKFGIHENAIIPLIEEIVRSEHIRLLGLMTMAPLTEDRERIRRCFRDLRELADAIEEKVLGNTRIDMRCLSMGMTNDYEIALEEGANMLRIGRAIFQS